MILFVLSLFCPLCLLFPFDCCAGFNNVWLGSIKFCSTIYSPPLWRGRGRVCYCKDTTSEGRFATFRATQFEINISREVKR